jgi:hypothetical protein
MRSALLVLVVLSGCGGAAEPTTLVFETSASQAVMSRSGTREVRVFERLGRPVSRGVNALRLEVNDVSALTVTPWMPVMGHGSATVPRVARTEDAFVVDQLVLAMPGRWELRLELEGGTDDALITYDLE